MGPPPPVCPFADYILTAAHRTTVGTSETHGRSPRRARAEANVTNCALRRPSCRARQSGYNDILPTSVANLRGVDGSWNALTLHRRQRYKVHVLQYGSAPRPPLSSTYARTSGPPPSIRQFSLFAADVCTAGRHSRSVSVRFFRLGLNLCRYAPGVWFPLY